MSKTLFLLSNLEFISNTILDLKYLILCVITSLGIYLSSSAKKTLIDIGTKVGTAVITGVAAGATNSIVNNQLNGNKDENNDDKDKNKDKKENPDNKTENSDNSK
jgi:hypothetical protein